MMQSEAAALKAWVTAWCAAFLISLLVIKSEPSISPTLYCGIVGAIFIVSAVISIWVME